MSEVKVVRLFKNYQKNTKDALLNTEVKPSADLSLIAIGASTGGPVILQTLLKLFPSQFPPVLIVQHISPGFLEGLVDWLNQTTQVHVKIAVQGESLVQNRIIQLGPGWISNEH